MTDPKFLRVAKENTILYPNKEAVICEMIASDNTTYDATIGKAEVDLVLFIKNSKLSDREITEIVSLIELYGDEKYEDAMTERDMDDAGEDL